MAQGSDLPTTATGIAAAVHAGDLRAREVVIATLARIEAENPTINALVAVDGEAALAAADELDALSAAERMARPLAGVPLAVKDTDDATGYRTTFGSLAFADAAPAERDTPLVARLKAAGCVVVGKANTSELACMPVTSNLVFGPTRNPWDLNRGVGGSSGGPAAAVAAGLVPLATASDGGGSIRIPAAVCGLPGFKPSLGRVPHGDAVPPDWADISTKGILAADVADTLLGLDAIVGPHPLDVRSLPASPASWGAAVAGAGPARPRVAWCPTLGYARVDAEVLALCGSAMEHLAAGAGWSVEPVDSVWHQDPIGDWLTIMATRTLRSLDPAAAALLQPSLLGLLEAFGRRSAVELAKAEDAAHHLNAALVGKVFGAGFDLLACPTIAGQVNEVGVDNGTIDGNVDGGWIQMTYGFNLTRSPVATVPVGRTRSGCWVGLQLVGGQHDDVGVLAALATASAALADTVG